VYTHANPKPSPGLYIHLINFVEFVWLQYILSVLTYILPSSTTSFYYFCQYMLHVLVM